jgi:hypothetical protein
MRTMRRMAWAALALGLATGAANAASPTHEVTGRIQRLDPLGHHLTLKSRSYRYDPQAAGAQLHRGERVRILYRESHGHRYAIQTLPAV